VRSSRSYELGKNEKTFEARLINNIEASVNLRRRLGNEENKHAGDFSVGVKSVIGLCRF